MGITIPNWQCVCGVWIKIKHTNERRILSSVLGHRLRLATLAAVTVLVVTRACPGLWAGYRTCKCAVMHVLNHRYSQKRGRNSNNWVSLGWGCPFFREIQVRMNLFTKIIGVLRLNIQLFNSIKFNNNHKLLWRVQFCARHLVREDRKKPKIEGLTSRGQIP